MKSTGSRLKGKIAAVLIAGMMLSLLAGCGNKQEESTQYVSPTFSPEENMDATFGDATGTDASLADAIREAASMNDAASATDATGTDALPASLSDALPMGVYEEDTYYNPLGHFKVTVNEAEWRLFDAAGVASATDTSVDEISNLWSGLKSPYEAETSYCAIACEVRTGSNVIISYVSPSKNMMPDLTAKSYLSMALHRYAGASLGTVKFLGNDYYFLDIPKSESSVGRRVQLAMDCSTGQGKLILLITMTLQEDEELTNALAMFQPIE